jgi:hypothetical protein
MKIQRIPGNPTKLSESQTLEFLRKSAEIKSAELQKVTSVNTLKYTQQIVKTIKIHNWATVKIVRSPDPSPPPPYCTLSSINGQILSFTTTKKGRGCISFLLVQCAFSYFYLEAVCNLVKDSCWPGDSIIHICIADKKSLDIETFFYTLKQ